MESDSKLSDIVSTSANRKRLVVTSDGDTDSNCEEIVCPVRKRRRIIVSNSEEKSGSEDREIIRSVKKFVFGKFLNIVNKTQFNILMMYFPPLSTISRHLTGSFLIPLL